MNLSFKVSNIIKHKHISRKTVQKILFYHISFQFHTNLFLYVQSKKSWA